MRSTSSSCFLPAASPAPSGLLLALVWTAGFVPTFLEPGAASVLLAKPVGRSQLLLGKYLGVLAFVAFQVVLFVALTWLALGVRTQCLGHDLLVVHSLALAPIRDFLQLFGPLAVLTRSTVACVFGSLLFWLLAWGINYAKVMARAAPDPQAVSAATLALAEAAYWISPKPIDAGLILFNALDAQRHFEKPVVFKLLESDQGFSSFSLCCLHCSLPACCWRCRPTSSRRPIIEDRHELRGGPWSRPRSGLLPS